ncbi:MAG: EhaE family protein [Methanothermobacter sp.]|nr:EhaE family protein [Methanothermobacter sp.]
MISATGTLPLISFYLGLTLVLIGSLGVVFGPKTSKEPIVRIINLTVPSTGVALIFLSYNYTLAMLTFLSVNPILYIIMIRAIIRLEEMGGPIS